MKEFMKNKNIKKSILFGLMIGILVGTIGTVSYAMYTYTRTSTTNSYVVAGDIYMKYKETTALSISDALPSATYDNTKYFEFDIVGKNTSGRDIWYEIVLTDGTKPNNKNTKLDDKYLRFTLYEGNTMVVNGASFDDITNQRLYTGTVSKNTSSQTTTTYKLYMWIDNSVGIGTNTTYTMQQWNDIWAAVKVNVNARTETNPSCFTLSNKDDTNHTATISAYDATCGGTDIIIPKVIDGYTITEYGNGSFSSKGLTNVIIQDGVVTIMSAFGGNQLTNLVIPNSVTIVGPGAFIANQIVSVEIPESVQTIGNFAFQYNQLTSVKIGNGIISVGLGAFSKENSAQHNQNLAIITINKSCSDIKNNLLSNSTNYYPWLSGNSPYTGSYAAGTTIYGSNGEICDAY